MRIQLSYQVGKNREELETKQDVGIGLRRFNGRSDKRAAKQGETDILMNNMHRRREQKSTSMPLLPGLKPADTKRGYENVAKLSYNIWPGYNISEYNVYRELAMLSVFFIRLSRRRLDSQHETMNAFPRSQFLCVIVI